jgi:hypothetical protein
MIQEPFSKKRKNEILKKVLRKAENILERKEREQESSETESLLSGKKD